MDIVMARSFFLRCTVLNFAFLLVWGLLFLFARDALHRLCGKWVRVPAEQFDVLNLVGITLYKMGAIMFSLVPCVALYLMS